MDEFFDPVAILGVLKSHDVRFVVIGGFAAVAHGSTLPTGDLDITPQQARDNLERLSLVLTKLDARIRAAGQPEGLRFAHSGSSLQGIDVLNLTTRYGDLDIVAHPSGDLDYDTLSKNALTISIHGMDIPIASLADVINSSSAANQPNDNEAPGILREIEKTANESPAGPETTPDSSDVGIEP